jgi:hypothetical protein
MRERYSDAAEQRDGEQCVAHMMLHRSPHESAP